MNWTQLLSDKRFGMEEYTERKHDRSDFQRDYDRLVFSSPFRRMQNKTQVFPLPGSVFVHNRLTHSLEVSCVGRSLGMNVGRELLKRHPREEAHFQDIGSIVSAACLAHDMGNPPFGHSGERAISAYFKNGKGRAHEEKVRAEGGRWEDFLHFEGNANAFRLLTHQFNGRRKGGFALTYSTLASIVKYPYASEYAGKKGKFGFFQSEEKGFYHIANELGIGRQPQAPEKFVRYPLVYLVEAADDICYQVMDIEDACKLHILTKAEAIELLLAFFPEQKRDHVHGVMQMVDDTNEQLAYLRSGIIGILVDQCSAAFLDNEGGLLDGSYATPLIEQIGEPAKRAYAECSKVAFAKIYCAKEVVDVELAGHYIFNYLMDTLLYAIMEKRDEEDKKSFYSKLLLERIPEQYDINASSTYGQIQCIMDYISGMTDVYALDLYRKITGMSLPAV